MPRQVFEYDPPERFVAGTVGEPGARTFFLQARTGVRVTSVALEKEQVSALAERLDALLDEVARRAGEPVTETALEDVDTDPLDLPIDEEFRVGTLTLAWDSDTSRVVLEAFPASESDAEAAEGAAEEAESAASKAQSEERDALIVRLATASARAFVRRAQAVVSAGRAPCPLCGRPLDPEGHICPRQNGYRRRG